MPASRSPNRDAKSTARSRGAAREPLQRTLVPDRGTAGRRWYWPIALIVFAAVLAAVIVLLPASIVSHFLPPSVHAEDFSGNLWHGAAGRITVNAHDAGALEWRLHPASLFGMALAADLHWVKGGFVIDAAVTVDRREFSAHDIKGGGPIEDLRDAGVAAGWRGRAEVDFSELRGDFVKPLAAAGEVRLSDLRAAQVAGGTDLGGYELRFAGGTGAQAGVNAVGDVTAQLNDSGGPLEVQGVIRYAAKEHTATLSGTLRERPDAPAALRSQIDNLAQLRGRDPQGRVPVEFEFAL